MSFTKSVDTTKKLMLNQSANILTMMNLGSGSMALILIMKDQASLAAGCIFLAAVCDMYDGKVARNLNISSDFGKQLDSLADLISFGVAPALLIYQSILFQYSITGILLTIMYILCGAIRLARFNVTTFTGNFQGLPIPAAGCLLALFFLMKSFIPSFFFMFILLGLSVLMIGTFKVKKI